MKKKNFNTTFFSVAVQIALFLIITTSLFGQTMGTISGTIIDKSTKQTLPGANIIIVGNSTGTASDINGKFNFPNLTTGNYKLELSFIGYKTQIKSDIIVRPNRTTFINVELEESTIEVGEVTVITSYFEQDEATPISAANLSYEEIRRAPGSAGDISRALSAVPGVSAQSDQFNDLMVRGGSPSENGYYINNIPIPNINHFPVLGAAGGAIGIINTDFIQDVNFYSGGFSSVYGDRLSSVMDVSYREGNRENIDLQLDLNFSGFGGQIEGPLAGGKGSYMLSAKRSYLDLVQEAMGLTGETPRYGDVQGKIDYDFNPNNKLTALFIYAPSSRESDRETFREQGIDWYTAKWEALQNTAGINWQYLWGKNGYSNTSITFNGISRESEDHFVDNDKVKIENTNSENMLTIRNKNFYKIDKNHKVDFGIETKFMGADYDYFYAADTNYAGQPSPELKEKKNFHSTQLSAFSNFIWQPFNRLTAVIGLRGDYYQFNETFNFSPRLSLSYKVNEQLTFNASGGFFHQSVPLFLISQNEANENLKNLKSTHLIAGLDYMLSADTKLTLEVYSKEYQDFPLSPNNPEFFILDQGTNYGAYNKYGVLESVGKSYARGIDLLVQKKLAEDFYGIVSASYFRSRYKDYNGTWRDRLYDNKFLVSIIGGYKPNNFWEFSARWNYAGGAPYTPFNVGESQKYNTGIYDMNKINGERMEAYHSLNLRVDKRFYFNKSSLVVYLSVWNVYNRENVAIYYWNKAEKRVNQRNQWSFLPFVGIEYEL